MTMANTSDNDNNSSDFDSEDCKIELNGILSKWTNYIHGWQDRFIVIKDCTLSYYKSEIDSNLGCRGALSLKKATVKPHEFDECRFDVSVNDCVWYLRTSSPEERKQWIDVLKSFKVTSQSECNSALQRYGSTGSLQSLTSQGRPSAKLTEKVLELETYFDLLHKQSEQLQLYYDLCFTNPDGSNEDLSNGIDAVKLPDGKAVTLTPMELRESKGLFRTTCDVTLTLIKQCMELMRLREQTLKAQCQRAEKRANDAEQLCVALKNELRAARLSSYPGPDLEEGPHSTLPEDEFYDAVETFLDKMESEQSTRVVRHTRDDLELPPPSIDNRTTLHPLWPEIERISSEQLQAAFEGVGGEIGWQLFAEEGEMRMYRREVEVDGMVMDPLKAMHRVRGVSAREMCHYFFNPHYRYDWEATLEKMTVVENIAADTLVFHQTFKRVWPASQRDALFWSHARSAPEHTYAVVNHSTHHPDYPPNVGSCIRLHVTVCLACKSTWPEGEEPTRDNVTTNIAYCSTVNPGGWAPAGVLRAVYKREYPKFLKRFTNYVVDQCKSKPLAL